MIELSFKVTTYLNISLAYPHLLMFKAKYCRGHKKEDLHVKCREFYGDIPI